MNHEDETRLGVGVIGCGKVGAVIGRALRAAGHAIVGVTASSDASRDRAEAMLPGVPVLDIETVVERAEVVLFTVTDDVLGELVSGLARLGRFKPGQIVLHCALARLTTLDPLLHVLVPHEIERGLGRRAVLECLREHSEHRRKPRRARNAELRAADQDSGVAPDVFAGLVEAEVPLVLEVEVDYAFGDVDELQSGDDSGLPVPLSDAIAPESVERARRPGHTCELVDLRLRKP